jgi:hypothetical protein
MPRKALIFISLIGVLHCFAQEDAEKLLRIEGRVVDVNNDPIPYAHILMLDRQFGVAGDIFGCFSIGAYPGDTLTISAVSFHKKKFIVPSAAEVPKSVILFMLQSDTITLEEQEVYAWHERDELLKAEIEKLIDKELITGYDLLTPSYGDLLKNQFGFSGMSLSMPGPFSLIYSTFSKEARIRRALEKIILQEMARKRYNDALIYRITGLKDKYEINMFVYYCNLDNQFVIQSTDYELYAAIMSCYKDYSGKERAKK